MNLSLKNKLIISGVFALYQMLTNLFFGSYEFIEVKAPLIIYFITLIVIFSLLEFSSLYFLLRSLNGKGINKLIFSGSFLVIGIIGSTVLWLIFASNSDYFLVFILSFFIASFLPTLLFLFYFIYKETEDKFSKLGKVSLKQNENSDLEEDKLFHLENPNGKILLEVAIKNIICFEANDNYVVTYYLKNENDLAKSMERISLKKIEEMLTVEEVEFKRVHKSYLINPSFLDEIKGRAQAYKIKLHHFNNLIPVSRSYDVNQLKK